MDFTIQREKRVGGWVDGFSTKRIAKEKKKRLKVLLTFLVKAELEFD